MNSFTPFYLENTKKICIFVRKYYNMEKVYRYIIIALFAICVGFSIYTGILNSKYNKTQKELANSINNIKAYEYENSQINKENRQFLLTIDQLNYSKDSLIQKLNDIRKELHIKDKDLKELQYIASKNNKVDSIFIKDTIFIKDVQIDTTITDEWASLQLHLEYPNQIVANYSFNNEEIIIASSKKETIAPPKKCWLGRLFQKKHTVVTVEVIQQNPYCTNKEQKHIKLIE